jgi:hypothetical protein
MSCLSVVPASREEHEPGKDEQIAVDGEAPERLMTD